MTELYLTRARNAASVQECMSIYQKWAPTYNAEVNDDARDYVAPGLVATAALHSSPDPGKCVILDAGCGTGLVGEALLQRGATIVDGIDLSESMLGVARETGVYRNLARMDLTKQIGIPDDVYDIATCVGTFTAGHVGPEPALSELVRTVKSGGTVVATILHEHWNSTGFKDAVERLETSGLVTLVADETIDYVKGHGDTAILLILRKNDMLSAKTV